MTAYREAWRLAWPLILSNLSVPLLGVVDTAVVGHLPAPHYLGAVAIGAVVFDVLYFVLGFLRMATTGLCAQALGRGDHGELRAGLVRALVLAALLALALLALGPWLARVSVWLFDPGVRVAEGLGTYLSIRLFGVPAGLVNLVLLGWLLGRQNARGPMLLLLTTNGINMALDVWFVLGLRWAVAGVAVATVIAEYAGLALGVLVVRRELVGLAGRWHWRVVAEPAAFRRLLVVNRDIFLRSLSLETAFVAFTALGARQGEVVLAANAVLLNFLTIAAFGLDGFAHAAEAMVGRQIGARDQLAFRAAIRASLSCSLGLAALLALAFLAGGPAAIHLMTALDPVRAVALDYLPYVIVLPLVAVWAFLFDGVFVGATRTAALRNGMAVALGVFLLSAWALVPRLGNHGLWLALLSFMAARGLWLALVYRRIERTSGFVGGALSGETAR